VVFEKVRAIVVEQLDVEEDIVTLDSSIIDDLNADSLDIVDMVMTIEEEFDIEVPDEEIENMKTIGDIVKFVEDQAK
jgi:acyl carrier protein